MITETLTPFGCLRFRLLRRMILFLRRKKSKRQRHSEFHLLTRGCREYFSIVGTLIRSTQLFCQYACGVEPQKIMGNPDDDEPFQCCDVKIFSKLEHWAHH